jgi:hypothetical protein
MRRRRKPDEEKTRLWITKAGNRLSPILLVGETSDLFACNLLAPPNKPGTTSTLSYICHGEFILL